ncbi:MAG: hypothetical protein AB1452_15795 [Pseudomonadota bacterium]
MDEFLSNPAVQAGGVPFLAALIAAVALQPVRLGGLALVAAFLSCMYLVSGLQLTPLTATRKILILGIAAPAVGVLADFAFRPTRAGAALMAVAAGAAALWVFWPVLAQKSAAQAWLLGATTAVATVFMVGFAQLQLASDALRAGAAALGLGLGVGVASIFSASASYGSYGIALGAGAGGFLLPQMIRGKPAFAGTTFALTAMLLGGLVAAGAMILAQLPWYAVLVLALVPLAARMPVPARAPVWLQAVLFSLYAFVVAAVACALAWPSNQP